MAFSNNPNPNRSEIFINPALQSALNILSTHLQKQPPSSYHLNPHLTRLRRSLLQILQKNLSFATQESTHLLTQLKDAAYAAEDLVDELDYVALQQEVQEFNRLSPGEPSAGPSVSDIRIGDGVCKMASRPVLDSREARGVCENAAEDRIIEIVVKLGSFAAHSKFQHEFLFSIQLSS